MQRPTELAAKPYLTPDEAADVARRTLIAVDTDRARPTTPPDARALSQLAFNEFWHERASALALVDGRFLSSLILDPVDGRMPALTPEGERRAAAQERVMTEGLADDPEQRRLSERCLGSHAGPPMLPIGETDLLRIVQTATDVVIAAEASGDARIVPIAARPPVPSAIVAWRGISIGGWDGDTLVVETTRMRPGVALGSSRVVTSAALRLTERLRAIDADSIVYEFTIDDPDTFVRPWSAVLPLTRTRAPLFEYACHEGNYALGGILRGARYEEQRGPHGEDEDRH